MSSSVGSFLGEGTFGVVYKGNIDGQDYAFKRARGGSSERGELLNEDIILRCLWKNQTPPTNIIKRIGMTLDVTSRPVLVLELWKMSVRDYFRRGGNRFSLEKTELFTKQLANALECLKGAEVIHWDIKPPNILMNETENFFVLADFGSDSFAGPVYNRRDEGGQTLWYRSPEVILEIMPTHAIDMWSVAAVVAEVYLGRALFQTVGSSRQELMALQFLRLGEPYPNDLVKRGSVKGGNLFKDSRSVEVASFQSLVDMLKRSPVEAQEKLEQLIDLLEKMLVYDPEKRATPIEVLEHPFLAEKAEKQGSVKEDSFKRTGFQKTYRDEL